MIVPDTNLLLYAHLATFPEHPAARRWWEGLLRGEAEIGLTAPVVFGFVRLSTSARIFDNPLTVEETATCVESWFFRPHVRFLLPGPEHLSITLRLLRSLGTAAKLTTDAQIAAYAIEYQGEVHSNDADFVRFPGLRFANPLTAKATRKKK